MSLDRIEGKENLYIGSIFALRRPKALMDHGITHVLSVVGFKPREMEGDASKGPTWNDFRKKAKHMMIDIDDVDDEDLLIHLPEAVRFIDEGLYPKRTSADGESSSEDELESSGAVFVHCAMGKSRSVATAAAYLLWKYPQRFSRTAASSDTPEMRQNDAREAVNGAIEWIRKSRSIADPNWGFRSQLKLWWEMGCPDDVESHPIYRKWAYKREIERSVACGMAPELRFEDEEISQKAKATTVGELAKPVASSSEPELRCRKCRKTLATARFIVPVNHGGGEAMKTVEKHAPLPSGPCPHHFIEPLSWMRPTLEQGELDGRLCCPNAKCGASVGRYSWKGFQCSCGEWVTPAFSLQKSKVDVVTKAVRPPASLGIRMPPGAAPRENL
ncbi:hypothetical protein jhhlp_000385 [Lomentospora prolificans]|uniref:protein-tyrosine-phosphatase n=1 Tax=Lomentospora prolificans TaxID=41688 RepID=A0A2N3NKT1_9PEZI|nr:hypothetical protein jhhlp_000385 [Lomentospora prolificans]